MLGELHMLKQLSHLTSPDDLSLLHRRPYPL